MPNVTDLLNQYINAGESILDPKQSQVAAAAQAKKQELSQKGYLNAAASDVGLAQQTSLSDFEGDPLSIVMENSGLSDYTADTSRTRRPLAAIGDAANSAASAAFMTVPQIANVGVSAFDANAGAAVTRFIQQGLDNAQSHQSEGLNARRRAYGARNEVTSAYNRQLQEDELSKGSSSFMAGLRRVGRDALSAVSNTDGVIASDLISSGVGSILTSGPIGKSVGFLGKAAMPTAIGLQEGGSAHHQTSSEVLGMSHEELAASSPSYRQALADGHSPEEARNLVARAAGVVAGGMAAGAGALTGKLVAGFEATPFRVGSLGSAVSNILKEGVEEGLQGATGQGAQNIAKRIYADEGQDQLEGVGEGVGTGVLAGLGTGAVVQAPGLALNTAVESAKLVGRTAMAGVKAAGDAINSRAAAVDAETAAQSPVAPAKLEEAMGAAAAVANDPVARAEVENEILSNATTDEERQEASDYVNRVFDMAKIDPEAETGIGLSQNLRDTVVSSTDRFDALRKVADIAADEEASHIDRLEAGLYLMDALDYYQNTFNKDLPEAIRKTAQDSPALKQLQSFQKVLDNIDQHPKIQEAINAARKLVAANTAITPDAVQDVSTPEGQQAANVAIGIAQKTPDLADPDVNDTILAHASRGDIQLTPAQKGALEASSQALRFLKEQLNHNKRLGLKDPATVSGEIQIRNGEKGASATEHMKGVLSAVQAGNTQLAKARLEDMMLFAQHMQNKVLALNENLNMGNGGKDNATKYRSLTGDRKWLPSETGLWVNPKNAKSVVMAQQIAADAKAVETFANVLALAHPQLGVRSLPKVSLDPRLDKPAKDVEKSFKRPVQQAQEQRPTEGPETEPTETVVESPAPAAPAPAVAEQPVEKEDTTPAEAPQASPDRAKAESRASEDVDASSSRDAPKDKKFPSEAREPEQKSKSLSDMSREERKAAVEKAAKAAQQAKEADAPIEPTEQPSEPAEDAVSEEASAPRSDREATAPEEAGNPGNSRKSGIREAFPNLVGNAANGVVNWFLEAFTMPEKQRSRLVALDNPILTIREAIQSQDEAEQFAGKPLKKKLTPAVIRGYDRLIRSAAPVYQTLTGRLDAVLNKKIAKNGPTFKEALLNGNGDNNPVNTWRDMKVFNLVGNVDGKLGYDQNLLGGAILAGLHWALTSAQSGSNWDAESLADILGIPVENAAKYISWFNNGTYTGNAVADLARTIEQFWGVKPSRNAEKGKTAVSEAMAKEVLIALQEAKLITIEELDVTNNDNETRTYQKVNATISENILEDTRGFRDALSQLIAVDHEETNHIGTPPTQVSDVQTGNNQVRLTKQQKQMVKSAQEQPYHVDTNMAEFLMNIGKDMAVRLFGHDVSNPKMNKAHKRSLEGFNLTITGAFDHLSDLLTEMELLGNEAGKTPIYYEHRVSRVGRLHMQGSYNPQSNKLIRTAILPTRSTIDLSDVKQAGLFDLAVAQHLGVKVHRVGRQNAIQQLTEKLTKDYSGTTTILLKWAESGKTLNLTETDIATIRDEFGGKVDPGTFHALMEWARAFKSKDRTNFETSLYLEADGVTDGPINALMHLASGGFSSNWLQMMAKGGLFIGSSIKTLAQHIVSDGNDLYKTTTNVLSKVMAEDRAKYDRNEPRISSQRKALLFAMDKLFGSDLNFDLSTGELSIDRGIAKNPLTVTVYGSGLKGIANKLTGELINTIYEQMSEGDLDPMLVQALERLTYGTAEYITKKDKYFLKEHSIRNNPIVSGPDFEFSNEQIANIQQNMMNLFVRPLNRSIDQVIGTEVNSSKDALRDAVQVQSIFLQNAFRTKINAALAAKKAESPAWQTHHFLSQSELDAIHADVISELNGLISSPTQNFYPAGSSVADISDPSTDDITDEKKQKNAKRGVELTRSLDSKLATPVQVEGPGQAGVRGIPYLVIGSGDGQMIQNIATAPDHPQGAMYVFDGVNLKLSTVEADSQVVNEAVYRGWLNNPLGDAAKAFSSFAESLTDEQLSNLSERELQALDRALGLNEQPNIVTRKLAIDHLKDTLSKRALESQARKNVLARVNLAIDHMASAESPFVQEDKLNLSGTLKEVAAQLNGLYAEELKKLRGETVTTAVEEAPLKRKAASSIRSMTIRQLQQKLAGVTTVTPEQKLMLHEAIRVLADSKFQIFLGSAEEIAAFAQATGRNILDDLDGVHGFVNVAENSIYIMDATTETLVHELIHASTFLKVSAFFKNPKSLSQSAKEAIVRLDALMGEFMSHELPSDISPELFGAITDARNEIQHQLNKGDHAAAVNEFMAWVLANQELTKHLKTVESKHPLIKMMHSALDMIMKLVFGDRQVQRPGKDILSNLRFNTQILMSEEAPTIGERISDVLAHRSAPFGTNERLSQLRDTFARKIASVIRSQPDALAQDSAHNEAREMLTKATDVAESFNANGFRMTPQALSTFKWLVAAFMTEANLNPNTLVRLQSIYDQVMKNITVESFMQNPDNDIERYWATKKFNLLTGNFLVEKDRKGRSTLLPAFFALANVSEEFRELLSKIETPRADRTEGKTLDAMLENFGSKVMDNLATITSGDRRDSPDVAASVAALTEKLMENAEDQHSLINQYAGMVGNGIDRGNDYVVSVMDRLANLATDKLDNLAAQTNNKYVKAGLTMGKMLTSIASEARSEETSRGVMDLVNRTKLWRPLSEIVAEFVGRTRDNAAIYDMIKLVRSTVQRIRQQFRERLPQTIASKFSRKLTDAEWTHLFNGMGKTDLASLKAGMRVSNIIQMLQNPSFFANHINVLEEQIQGMDRNNSALLFQKAKELAEFMTTGKVSGNLLRNAYAVAHLFGEAGQRGINPTPALINAIDQLVTFYALDMLPDETKEVMTTLAQEEPAGMEFTLHYLVGQRVDEMAKTASTTKAEINHFKGHVPTENQNGQQMIVADDSEFVKLRHLGFTKVDDYLGSNAENSLRSKSYYYAPLSGRAMFNQGIIQNVRATAYGVDPATGYSVGRLIAGRITDPVRVGQIVRAMRHNQNSTEPLMPIYDDNGRIVAFERSVRPEIEARVEKVTDLSKAIGIWRGRQVEESSAAQVNNALITALHDMYTREEPHNADAYVNLFDLRTINDPVIRDAVNLITPETRAHIENMFGEGQFWVRKDLMNNVIGYRNASVGDNWTGLTRVDPNVQKSIRTITTAVFGVQAYKYLLKAENFWQTAVTDARVTIVVKSVIVPVANMISNVYHLSARGVPLKDIIRSLPKKTAEVDSFVKSHLKKIDLEAELRTAEGDIVKSRKLKAEIQAIEDAHKRLSIWPLIEAGEFASVSDVGITHDELMLSEGRISEYMEKLTNRLPDGLKTLARYGIISRDTALFKGLQRSVEYGDFLAKAILYDDLTKRQRKDTAYALGRVTEEFINYDYLPGRTRTTLENMGLLWFWNYKIRATKIAMSTLRNNPLHLLLAGLAPQPDMFGSIGMPISDNVFALAEEGKLDYSIGPSMGFHAYSLNPWANVMGL